MINIDASKDISSYKPKFFGNLTKRQFKAACVTLCINLTVLVNSSSWGIDLTEYRYMLAMVLIDGLILSVGWGDSFGMILPPEKYLQNLYKQGLLNISGRANTLKGKNMLSISFKKADDKIMKEKYMKKHPENRLY